MIKTLQAKYHLDSVSECLCRHVKSTTENFVLHNHDYYELFLTLGGTAKHKINGHTISVDRGCLIFVRDFDVHDYCDYNGEFEFINLAFSKNTLLSLFDFLGSGHPFSWLLEAPLPPMLRLSAYETEAVYYKLAQIQAIDYKNKAEIRYKTRLFLTELLTDYFSKTNDNDAAVPYWLKNACQEMRLPENFIAGKERFFALTGKTREHATRTLQQYYRITPSEFINDLRLTYAANLILTSNLKIIDICYECGFQNLSWFYQSFSEKYQTTPADFRKNGEY